TVIVSLMIMLVFSKLPKYYLILIISPFLSIAFSFSIPIFIVFIMLLLFILYKSKLSFILIGFTAVTNIFLFFLTPFIWSSLKTYQQNRILTFLDPMRDPFGAGYQIIQSKISIGSGNLIGKGFLNGTQKNLNFLPEHHTDFIFSVIGEEFGFFGCLIVLSLFFLFLIRIVKGIEKLKRTETRCASVGILSILAFQIFINIGMNIGIAPTTGIPLPFISYGGSSLLINVISTALILKFLKERKIFE
ncbi:MAG: rod shape-determining protein RodA, partial [Candidatus Cloacimonetes bacterium]|nr:rod shape-determining protein RodA [Candidatus Cloacimonadota bacterium]